MAVLVPSSDTMLEQELPALLDGRASVHVARMSLPDVTPAGLAVMEADAVTASRLLADIEPDILLYGCTSGSFFRGVRHERHLAQRLADITGAPVLTTASAVARALARRGARVRLRTPYTAELTAAESAYLAEAGLEVTSASGLGITRDDDIARVSPERLMSHIQGTDHADVALLSCTNLPTLEVLPRLVESGGLDVVTSNTAAAESVIAALDGRLEPLATPGGSAARPVGNI